MEHDYKTPWQSPITKEQWQNFLDFSFDDQDRPVAYEIITRHAYNKKTTFAEIGYGDFQQCFKQLHDEEKIIYHGTDITEQFHKYAKEQYPSYDFQNYNFYEENTTYDIPEPL